MPGADPRRPDRPDPWMAAAAAMVFVSDPTAPVLDPDDLRHLVQVLRLRPGEPVVACDGRGGWAPCRISGNAGWGTGAPEPDTALEVDGPVTVEARPRPAITVAFAPVKGDRPEWVVQKLAELGVDQIVPLLAARSVVRWEGDRALRAVDRLRRITRQASSQCRRPWLPAVTDLTVLSAMTERVGGPVAMAHPGGDRPSLAIPAVAVGPEGGWTDEELALGGPQVGFGATVLRAETAAVVGGTVLCALRGSVVGSLA